MAIKKQQPAVCNEPPENSGDAMMTEAGDAALALRQRALTALQVQEASQGNSHGQTQSSGMALHELQVHQIELEMQNEELRHAQAELEESRAVYFDLYDMAPVGYCTLTLEGGLIAQANLTLALLLGVDRRTLVRAPLSRFVIREDQDVFYHLRNRLTGAQGPQSCELRMVRGDGSPLWVRMDCSDQSDKAGARRMVIADISAHKKAQDLLQKSEVLNSAVLDSLSANIAVLDPHGNIVRVNEAWRNYGSSNCAPADALNSIGMNYLDACRGSGEEVDPTALKAAEGLRSVLSGASSSFQLEYPCHSPTKESWFRVNVTPMVGAVGGAVVSHEEITERKVAQELLETSLKEKEALLKEVHHRVKNNLQVITSLLRLESRRTTLDSTKAVLGDMQSRIRAMSLLHESLYRSGTLASVDLGSYLRQLATQAFQAQQTQSGAVQLEFNLGSVQIGMDQAIPCGLLVNELVSNCLKHGFPAGATGRVRIDLQPLDAAQQWRLCVRDTGVGLPENFEDKRHNSLGLQLASDLARQIGGTLVVSPNHLNKGVTFAVNFQAIAPVALVMPA